jgi:hypothetical protein
MNDDPTDLPRVPGTPSADDLPPTGQEARAQDKESVAPIVWIALGILAIGVFILALIYVHGTMPQPSPGK